MSLVLLFHRCLELSQTPCDLMVYSCWRPLRIQRLCPFSIFIANQSSQCALDKSARVGVMHDDLDNSHYIFLKAKPENLGMFSWLINKLLLAGGSRPWSHLLTDHPGVRRGLVSCGDSVCPPWAVLSLYIREWARVSVRIEAMCFLKVNMSLSKGQSWKVNTHSKMV